jgi:hypothetical protein
LRARRTSIPTTVNEICYWSGTENAPNALAFLAVNGKLDPIAKNNKLGVVAVRPGDVAAAVPEPQTLALALQGLCATAVVRRRRRSR